MKVRPILFSGPMIRAILGGTKTQTRRIVKHPLAVAAKRILSYKGQTEFDCVMHDDAGGIIHCPYGQPGDRLWVRELWRIGAWNADKGAFAIDYCDGPRCEWLTDPTDHDGERFNDLWIKCSDELEAKGIEPNADGEYQWPPGESPLRWRPSIHMPRWASRILLEIVSVRVERLQDISEADAVAEGAPWAACGSPQEGNHKTGYAMLWESINGPGSWPENPWVWVIDFARVDRSMEAT